MDISAFSTEALRHKLQLRQARPVFSGKRRRLELPTFSEFEEETDDDSSFVPERRSYLTRHDASQSREQSTRQQSGPHQTATGRKRRRSTSCELIEGVVLARSARHTATGLKRQRENTANGTNAGGEKTVALQEEEDRRLAERLQAEQDDLLIFTGGQWTNTRLGTKDRPIDLDCSLSFSKAPRAARSVLGHDRASKPMLKPNPHQQETFDAAIARQLQREETQAQDERLRQAASRVCDCAVCGGSALVIEMPSLSSCSHEAEVCGSCYASWITSQLEANGWQEVKCPGISCKINLAYEEIQAYARREVFERYDAFKARSALNSDPNFRWCRAEGCLSGQIHDTAEVGNAFACVECHARFCIVHQGPYHDDETCEEYEYRTSGQKERDERRKEDEASERAMKKIAKRCPRETCRVPIQKNKGCNHMTCELPMFHCVTINRLTLCRLEVQA